MSETAANPAEDAKPARKPMGRPRRSAEATATRHFINLWIEGVPNTPSGVSINFFMDEAEFTALERWRIRRKIYNRTHAIKMLIVHALRYPRDPYNPGLLEALEAWQRKARYPTRSGAVKAIIRRGVRTRRLWTAPILEPVGPPPP